MKKSKIELVLYWIDNKIGFLKRIPVFVGVTFLIVLIVSFIYWCITSNFDFVSIQDVKSEDINRFKSIQIIESLKLVLLITTPILTMILFLNTINVQKLNSKNLGKDSMSKDFYNLLGLFKQEQEKSKDSLERLGMRADSNLETVAHRLILIETNKKNRDDAISENECFSKQCPNFFKWRNERYRLDCENEIDKLQEFIGNNYYHIKYSYKEFYSQIGTYFRILHRLIKVINDRFENGIINEDERMMYIGILRAQLSTGELLVVLVNSLEISKGIGLGVELLGCSFFGDEIDIDNDQHFNCPSVYRNNLKKYFVHSFNSEKERKFFRECFLEFRGDKDITNFQSLIDKIDSKKN